MLSSVLLNSKARLLSVLSILAVSLVLTLVLFHTPVHAAECASVDTTIIQCDSKKSGDTQESGIWSLLLIMINILTAGVGVMAVAGFIYAAVLWSTAEDKADQLNKAKSILTNTCIGLIAFALMYSLLQFLVPGGIFNSISAPRVSISKQKDMNPGGSKDCSKCSSSSSTKDDTTDAENKLVTLTLAGVKNFRDIGGSGTVKGGLILRSAQLSKATASDIKKLQTAMKGGTIIDLRDGGDSDKSIPGTTRRNLPVTPTLDYKTFVNNAANRKSFSQALTIIANTNKPVLIHCVAGKDRTGWAIAMLMHIAGASQSQIMTEYMRSASSGEVQEDWMLAGLREARKRYKTIDGYLTEGLGLSSNTVAKIKKRLQA